MESFIFLLSRNAVISEQDPTQDEYFTVTLLYILLLFASSTFLRDKKK